MPDKYKSPWMWVPSLYFVQGIPYVMVMTVSVIMYKRLGISNSNIALYTGWLYLPWVIKPLWSPVVDLLKTKRLWIVVMQLIIGAGFAGVALSLPLPGFFKFTLAFFWLLAFSSATHDIAADGFYMLALKDGEQAYFVGIRSTFYRIAMLAGQGLLVIAAGYFERKTGNIPLAWSYTFYIIAVFFVLSFLYHQFILPKPYTDISDEKQNAKFFLNEFVHTFLDFFKKDGIGPALTFLLVFRLGEAQLLKMASPFLLDPFEHGGLGLSTTDIGIINGTFGLAALMLGGVIGGLAISKRGLKYWLLPMTIAMNAPNIVYIFLSLFQPTNIYLIGTAVVVEQLGYGFGFTAYVMFMIWFSEGEFKTSHYAICTGFMALGMMLPGMVSGFLQEVMGYGPFFIWVALCSIPGFVIIRYLLVSSDFGLKNQTK